MLRAAEKSGHRIPGDDPGLLEEVAKLNPRVSDAFADTVGSDMRRQDKASIRGDTITGERPPISRQPDYYDLAKAEDATKFTNNLDPDRLKVIQEAKGK